MCEDFSNNLFISAFLISLIMAKDLNIQEQNLFGNYLQIIGQNLTSLATFEDFCDNKKNKDS